MMELFAHSEAHTEEKISLLSQVLHQPTWIGLLVVAITVAVIYLITRSLKLSLAARLLVVVGSTILISVLYMPHNPQVSGIVLSAGFIVTFLLTFTLLARVK